MIKNQAANSFQLHLLMAAAFLLAGCSQPAGTPAVPINSPRTYISPAVPPDFQQTFLQCLTELPDTAPLIYTGMEMYPELGSGDIFLWWGDPAEFSALQEADASIYYLGELKLTLLAPSGYAPDSLPPSLVRRIFTGTLSQWSEIDEQLPPAQIEVWVLPDHHPAQAVFEKSLLQGQSATMTARVAPGLEEIKQTSLDRESMIGLSIEGWSRPSQEIRIEPLPDGLQLPLLLVFTTPLPAEQTQVLLNCLTPVLE
jgi:hypothetical protein